MQPFLSPSIAAAGRQFSRGRPRRRPRLDHWRSASDMKALQQSIHVALSLGLLEAVCGYDMADEVVVTRQRGKVLLEELTPLRAHFLENDLPGPGSHLRLCSSHVGLRAVAVS